ncbi:MAG: glycerol-3-phosphate 1-O-acyltransferase PlsY [Oscillospiraceae bacterium]|nr:glycerol-3-phosphate 1-O-acyltransferase PlsY [Oscillospiraceae bacterium]
MIILACVIAMAVGYLFGSINSAILTVKLLKQEDIRNFGSGNAGLTNTLRCFGKTCALLTLIGDLGKGIIAVLLSRMFANLLLPEQAPDFYMLGCLAGIFAIIGHVFPLYHHFKGGKGVLVGVSIFLILDWKVFLILIGIFAIILAISKYVSLASIIATACCPFLTLVTQSIWHAEYTTGQLFLHFGLQCIMAIMIIFMHRSNITRLRNHTERKFGEKKTS